jgi:hypothetical protein
VGSEGPAREENVECDTRRKPFLRLLGEGVTGERVSRNAVGYLNVVVARGWVAGHKQVSRQTL